MSLTFDDRLVAPGMPEGLRRIMSVPPTLPTPTAWPVPTTPATVPITAPAAAPAAVPTTPTSPTDPLFPTPSSPLEEKRRYHEEFRKRLDPGDPRPDLEEEHRKYPNFHPLSVREGERRGPRRGPGTQRGRGPFSMPDFARLAGIRTPQEALRFFGEFANNPAIASRLPPFMRGANSPLFSILSRLASGHDLSPDDIRSFITGMVPGDTTGGGRAPGSDVPATEDDPTKSTLTDLPGEVRTDPKTSSQPVAPSGPQPGAAPSVPAESTPGGTPTVPGTSDGGTPDLPGIGFPPGPYPESPDFPYSATPPGTPFEMPTGPLAPNDPRLVHPQTFPGMNQPPQGWSQFEPGSRRGGGEQRGALPTIERRGVAGAPQVAALPPHPETNNTPGHDPGIAIPRPAPKFGASANQHNRPRHYTGTITIDGQTFHYGTGGGHTPSLPYGRYYVHPGAVGPIGRRIGAIAGISDSNQPGNNTVTDPIYRGGRGTHAREGVEIHPSRAGYTNGCIGVSAREWPAFSRAFRRAATRGDLELIINADGSASIASMRSRTARQ